jgi:hypothetical protein
VGLHQCPSERKGEGVPVRSLRVPSHVPSHPQTAAKVRGFSPIASGFTAETDWLLEEDRFEPSVPLVSRGAIRRELAPVPAAEGPMAQPPRWREMDSICRLGKKPRDSANFGQPPTSFCIPDCLRFLYPNLGNLERIGAREGLSGSD